MYVKLIIHCFSLLYIYVSSVMRSSWHFNTSGFNVRFPRTPQNENKNWKNVHQITSIFYILLSFGVILRCLWGLEAIYIMFMSSVDQCTVKPVTRGHLNVEIGMSKLHFLWTKIYFNIEMYLRRGDTCHVGTLFEVSPRHRFHCILI